MIVYQIQSPIGTAALQVLIEQSAPEDRFIFMGQASANLPAMPCSQVKAYALNSDLIHFGVKNPPITGIDDHEWIEFCAQATQVISWF